MAATYDHPLTIARDTDFSFAATFLLSSGGAVTNITSVDADIRQRPKGPVITSFTATETSSGSGVFVLSLTRAQTKLLRMGLDYYYDIVYIRSAEATRQLRGKITIEKERTST